MGRHDTKREQKRKELYDAIKSAIPKSAGLYSIIGTRITTKDKPEGISWMTVKRYVDNHADLRAMVDNEAEVVVDIGENALLTAIKKGEPWAIRLFLTTKAKHRGYVTRTEFDDLGSRKELEDVKTKLKKYLDE